MTLIGGMLPASCRRVYRVKSDFLTPRVSIPALVAALCFVGGAFGSAAVVVDVASSTPNWIAISYTGSNPDPSGDQQTGGGEGDIVGNLSHPSAYTAFGNAGTPSLTDGTIGFRVRVGADSNPPGFDGALMVGIDANRDGALDLFIGVNNSGSQAIIAIWNPGTGLNISPSTTTIGNTALVSYAETSANYSYTAVTLSIDPSVGTATDINADGKNDYFLSFSVPFNDVVAQLAARGITGFTEDTPLSYVVATSTQGNSLNQDLNGVPKTYDPASGWAALGANSNTISSSGVYAVPEPGTGALLLSAAACGAIRSRPRKRRAAVAR